MGLRRQVERMAKLKYDRHLSGAPTPAGITISMDGRGRWMDNVFIERPWRSLKREDIYLEGSADGRETKVGI